MRTERIAYALYLERGSGPGGDLGDWTLAEDRIRSMRGTEDGSARIFRTPYVMWAEQSAPVCT
jgi:hypothetical protein